MSEYARTEWEVEDVRLPDFKLPSTKGREIGPSEYRQKKNLILAFIHGVECPTCRDLIEDLADEYQAVANLQARILVVVGGKESE